MTSTCRLLTAFSLTFMLLFAAGPAARAEEPAIVSKLLDAMTPQSGKRPTYASLEASGDTLTLKGLAVVLTDEEIDSRYVIDTLTLTGLREVADGRFQIDRAEARGMMLRIDGDTYASVPVVRAEDMHVRGLPANPTLVDTLFAGTTLSRLTEIPEIVLPVAGTQVTIENMRWTFDGDFWAMNGRQTMAMERLLVPAEALALVGPVVPFDALGYSSLEFSGSGTGSVGMTEDAVAGDFTMDLVGKDIGTLSMAGTIDRLPLQFIVAARQVEPGNEMAVLGQVGGITFSQLRFAFTDDSLVNRLVDFMSKTQNMDRDQVIATAEATVQLGLMELKNPEFTSKVAAAVNAFLSAPGTIAVLAAPMPVSVQQLMEAGQSPEAVMEVLKLEVTAN